MTRLIISIPVLVSILGWVFYRAFVKKDLWRFKSEISLVILFLATWITIWMIFHLQH